MIEIRRILCPVDFSEPSRRAIRHAVAMATWYDAAVTLLHVRAAAPLETYAPGGVAAPSAALSTDMHRALRADLERLAGQSAGTDVPVEVDVVEGSAMDAILARADAMRADLLVIGTHGRSGIGRLMLGSVAEGVLRRAHCPVLTVPRGVEPEGSGHEVLFRRMVCAVDFSDGSSKALGFAISLAQELGAHLTVMHVMESHTDPAEEAHEVVSAGARTVEELLAHAEAEYRARLEEAIPDDARTYCTVDTVVASGSPHREILRVLEAEAADLLVAGVSGRGALDRLVFGSTAQQLVRQAPCPVLTLHGD